MVVCLHSGIISFSKTLNLKCLTMFWIRLCFNKCSVICTVYYIRNIQNSCIRNSFITLTFRNIQAYSALLRYIHAYWVFLRYIQAFSGILNTLCNPRIFTTLPHSEPWHLEPVKTLWNFDQAYSEPCHTQNKLCKTVCLAKWLNVRLWTKWLWVQVPLPFIQALFGHIQACSEPCVRLAYAETWHIRNPWISRTLP